MLSDLLVLVSAQEPLVVFSLLYAAEEVSDSVAYVGTQGPDRVNPHKTITAFVFSIILKAYSTVIQS